MNRFRKTLQSTQAAIDLASIMVGIIVIGIIGGVIGATVFAVIPWANDNAAKAELDSVKQAQNVYAGLASTGDIASGIPGNSQLAFIHLPTLSAAPETTTAAGASNLRFGSYDALIQQKLITRSDRVNTASGTNGDCYAITAYSSSGSLFWLDSVNQKVNKYSTSSTTACDGVTLSNILPAAYNLTPVAEPSPGQSTPVPTTPASPAPTTPPVTAPKTVGTYGFNTSRDTEEWTGSPGTSASQATGQPRTGAGSLSGSPTGSNLTFGFKKNQTFTAGKSYTITAWVYGTGKMANSTISVGTSPVAVVQPLAATTWTKVTATFTATSSTATYFTVTGTKVGEYPTINFYMDDVTVVQND